jgi:hypothetical protein
MINIAWKTKVKYMRPYIVLVAESAILADFLNSKDEDRHSIVIFNKWFKVTG